MIPTPTKAEIDAVTTNARELSRTPSPPVPELKAAIKGLLNVLESLSQRTEAMETQGYITDPKFRPTAADVVALRRDSEECSERGEQLSVKVSVAPAVVYLSWPNAQHNALPLPPKEV